MASATSASVTHHEILTASRRRIFIAHLQKEVFGGHTLLVVHFVSEYEIVGQALAASSHSLWFWPFVNEIRNGRSSFWHFIDVPDILRSGRLCF